MTRTQALRARWELDRRREQLDRQRASWAPTAATTGDRRRTALVEARGGRYRPLVESSLGTTSGIYGWGKGER